mgnify:FL=1
MVYTFIKIIKGKKLKYSINIVFYGYSNERVSKYFVQLFQNTFVVKILGYFLGFKS